MSHQQGYLTRIAVGFGLVKKAPAVRMQSINESAASQAARRAQLAPEQPERPRVQTQQPQQPQTHAASNPSAAAPRPVASSNPRADTASPQQRIAVPKALPDASPISRGNETDIATIMPVEATFTGDMKMETSFVLQCVVHGNVTQEGDHQIVLTQTGGIHGTLRARTAVIGGKIEGDVHVERLVVLATGEIHGNVRYSSLAMAEGAVVNGQLNYVVPNVVASADGSDTPSPVILRAVPSLEERFA